VDKQQLLKNQVLQVTHVLQAILGPMPLATLTCPACRIQFMEFRNQGRLGCPHDYNSLRAGLEPLLKRLHRKLRHFGKRPLSQRLFTIPPERVIELRQNLQDAIAAEDYARAIDLRDQIRLMDAEI
jgi:protein arginine kinase activator